MKTIVAALAALVALAAHAEGQSSQSNEARLDMGLFAPEGLIGASYTRDLIPHLQVEVGIGFGLSGFQLSAMPKLYIGSENRLYTGAGVSLGLFPGQVTDVWFNWDIVGYEHRFENGLAVNFGVGYFRGLAGSYTPLCWGGVNCSTAAPATDLSGAQAHGGVGYAF